MYLYLSKILPLFVMPLSLALMLVLAALWFVKRGMLKTGIGVLAVTVVMLWAASMPLVAGLLYRSLEREFPPVPLADVPVGDCIVLLGGAVQGALPPRVDPELSEAVDRVYKAAQLYRAGKGGRVVVSAGNQPWSLSPWAEADIIRDLLVEWGVPQSAIILEGSSRNTRENAVFSKMAIDSISCATPLLVTSAAHMPRAVAAFNRVGIGVVPVSTDVRVVKGGSFAFAAVFPDAHALAMTSDAIREWIGRWVYAWKGWG